MSGSGGQDQNGGELPLRDFCVQGFRAVRRLEIPDLRRVNLFVGKNNAGKSSLLEAIRLYLQRNERTVPGVIHEIVREHTDHRPIRFSEHQRELDPSDLQFAIDSVESLFHGSFDGESFGPIVLHQTGTDAKQLAVRLPWNSTSSPVAAPGEGGRPALIDPNAGLLELRTEAKVTEIPLEWFVRRLPADTSGRSSVALMIGASGFSALRTRQMWDRVSLAGQESLVEEALRTIVPELERVLLIGESGQRSILLKLNGVARPVPMQGMGDGVNRVFGIAVALILASGGALLIDEVENGLHYSIQEEVWGAIFALASRFHVQVFATTHSWDSVLGFQQAAASHPGQGVLYRLERMSTGEINPVAFTDADVAIAARHDVEIR